jgi:arylsulfatase
LIVRMPVGMDRGGEAARNVRDDHPVILEDLMPTFLEEAGVAIPRTVEGKSLSRLVRGKGEGAWREFMHGEHARPNGGWQYVTDGNEKFIYETMTGEEWFFDLKNDPRELRNRVDDAVYAERVELWRSRLVEVLAKRPQDGLVKDGKLVKGVKLPPVREELMKAALPGMIQH